MGRISLNPQISAMHAFTKRCNQWFKTYPQAVTFIMSAEGEKCLFSPCHASGALQTFKTVAVQKIDTTSKMKQDERYKTLSGSYILAHKSCYCSYTSRSRKHEQGKKTSTLTDTGVSKRLLKSHRSDFVSIIAAT